MFGFSKKRFLVTLGLSVASWILTMIVQAVTTFQKYIGTFSTGCQVTGYPIDVCDLSRGFVVSPLLIIIINILFWFLVVHLFIGFVVKLKAK